MQNNRIIYCVKYKKELPALDKPPIPGDLGQKILKNVSKEAWEEFMEFFKMVINEYRIDLTSPQADQIMEQKINEYFFDNNLQMPEGYIPPSSQ